VTVPAPLRTPVVLAPDRDFEAARAAAADIVAGAAAATWTDHNAPDPGITLLEALAWGVADLHYRTARRGLGGWPLEVLPDETEPLAADPAALLELAALLSGAAAEMQEAIAGAGSVRAAVSAIAGHAFGGVTPTWEQAVAAVRLLRAPVVLRGALDGSAIVAATVEARVDDDEAVARLRLEPVMEGLWDEELRALLERRRRRALVEQVQGLRDVIASATDVPALLTQLGALGLSGAQAELALALHSCPPGIDPELWEQGNGGTRIWPPHPVQARTVEPITGADYARRARTADNVRRAWAVPGIVLPGVGWDGRVVAAPEERPGAVTLLVEPEEPVGAPAAFLREVLRVAVGSEVDDPFSLWRDDLDPAEPRRTICDEVGAALLGECPITVKGTLYAPAGTDRAALVVGARARLEAFFAEGRAESRIEAAALECPDGIEGSWPPAAQPAEGWTPGDPIRLSELVQRLADDPLVLGMEGLQLAVGDGDWLPDPGITGHVSLPPDCVPVLADRNCLTVTLTLATECGHG
jgi:hypothetical protein